MNRQCIPAPYITFLSCATVSVLQIMFHIMQIRRVNTTHEYVLEKSETPLEIVPQIIRLFVEYIRPYGSTATV